jgi:hypothetical protein
MKIDGFTASAQNLARHFASVVLKVITDLFAVDEDTAPFE